MSEKHVIRIFLDRPDWKGITIDVIQNHAGAVGPDEFTPSNRIVTLTGYSEEMKFKDGKQDMVIIIEFTEWQPNDPVKQMVQNWNSLFGELPRPRPDSDELPPQRG